MCGFFNCRHVILIVIEEVYREYSDKKAPFYIALLDAKSAFDVVDIDILMRK
jgi:hypothetical protein